MENSERKTTQSSNLTDDVKNFYKGDLKRIIQVIFSNPTNGIYDVFKKPSEKAYQNSLILFASIFVLYVAGIYILLGEAREFFKNSDFIKIGIIPVAMMLMVTIIAFAIKSFSGKPDFKNELQTGGLCAIPLAIFILIGFVLKLTGKFDIMSFAQDWAGAGLVALLPALYILLMLINIFQQSLKASSTKDAAAWFLSPASILLAIYLTYQVSKVLF